MQYQNITRAKNEASFAQVLPEFDGTSVEFRTKTAAPQIRSVSVPMVNGTVRIVKPVDVVDCDTTCVGSVNESVEIRFNIKDGSTASLESMILETKRVLDLAVDQYALAHGLVPPSEAAFTSV